MNFEERIRRLQAQGKLTSSQAAAMSESVAGINALPVSARRPLPAAKIMIALAAALILVLLITAGHGSAPAAVQHVDEIMNTGEVGVMNKSMMTGLSIFIIVAPLIFLVMTLYNGLVAKEETVLSSWAQVESNYQRRADLVPNLIATVKAFADHETDVMTAVTKARADAVAATAAVGKDLGDENALKAAAQAQKALGQSMSRLMAVAENYPQLRSSDNFLALQDQLEGTENRINVARIVFNESVNDYNSAIRKMPGALIAGMAHFQRKAYFESDEGADKAGSVSFN